VKSPKRVGAIVVGVMLLLAVAGAVNAWKPWDPRMGAGPAARELQKRLHTKVRYRCERQDRNDSIPLKDVDYFCAPVSRPQVGGYWVATDRNHITAMEPAS
jgi:hypothetical protein